ncbi:MAG: circularly permuted type 2 ATP-grasp protein [Candidatus Hydrogenedentes bacterium]|nr:circularly permuted type 2 ATP-grasp protein [Candidatus Hydrogenedentota bacterium]
MELATYETEGFFDELFTASGQPRSIAQPLIERINQMPPGEMRRRQTAADRVLYQMGITFTVYNEERTTERVLPFDIIPRMIEARDWVRIESGLRQRIEALNLFIQDVYNDQKILKDGVIPTELVLSSAAYRPQCVGFTPPKGIWCHITGTDLVRDGDGVLYVLEDNMRCPSGVSYVLENRQILKRTFPGAFSTMKIQPVDDYPDRLFETLVSLAPTHVDAPSVAVLTPGIFNSAYFEHSYLAKQMGVELVEGHDLIVKDDWVFMRTTRGLERVDVIYRRIDDDFLDPKSFRPDSLLGVPGIMDAYKKGRVALANAPGTGIADDKAIYAYVHKIIKYYLDQDAILPNVPTYLCSDPKDREYVLANLDKLVVKAVNESGGYGMLVGPHATQEERAVFAEKIKGAPRNFIAQPTLSLSRAPTLVNGHIEGRHVDLRPYILYSNPIYVMPGGLTRVALRKGSLVVNSSQGGGSKDTWVLQD